MNPEPYVGPQPFKFEDRDRFFGRKDETDELVSLVMAHPVVLIYALSGVGKSSLVNAGLIPLLREEGYAAFPAARVEGVAPPGIDPASIANRYVFHSLECWVEDPEVPFQSAAELVSLSVLDFVKAWMAARKPERRDALPVLIFDQFEEIFTGSETRWKERNDFFQQIGQALAGSPVKVVFSLREEYIARLEPMAHYFPRGLRVRERLERLREPAALIAVTRPMEKFGLTFAEGVAEKLVEDLLGVDAGNGEASGEFVEPVQLQVVCRNLWDKLPDSFKQPGPAAAPRVITHEHLAAAGEVTAALSNYYTAAIEAAVKAAAMSEGKLRRWFGETLIASDHASLGLAVKTHAETAGIPEAAIRVLQSRYLIRLEKRGAVEWYELAHGRFIEPILRSNAAWFEERHGAESMRQQLEQRAADLNRTGGILEEWELGQAENFLNATRAFELGDHTAIVAMVQRSRELLREKHETRERELQQQAVAELQARQLEHNRRAIRFRNVLLTLLAVMSVVAILGWFRAQMQKREAQWQSLVSKARELAFRAMNVIHDDPERALLLAFHSYSVAATNEGVTAWHRALVESPIRLRLAGEHGHLDAAGKPCSVLMASYSRDGKFIVTCGVDNEIRIWDAEHGKFLGLVGEPEQRAKDWVWSVAFSPDGSMLAAGSKDGTLRVWPWPAPAAGPWPKPLIFSQKVDAAGALATVHGVAFEPGGKRVLAVCHDGTARLWDLASQREVVRFTGHRGFVRAGSFSPDATRLVTAAQDNTAKVWSLVNLPAATSATEPVIVADPLLTLKPDSNEEQGLWDAEFSADGTTILTAGADHFVMLWNAGTGQVLAEANDHDGPVIAARFIDDRSAVSVGIDKTIRLWKVEEIKEAVMPDGAIVPSNPRRAPANARRMTLKAAEVYRGHTDFLRNVDVSPGAHRIVTASRDGTACVWQLPPLSEVTYLAAGGIVWDAAFSPDGRNVVTGSGRVPAVWSVADYAREPEGRPLPGHAGIVKAVAWSAAGRIASGSSAGIVQVCDGATGADLHTYELPPFAAVNRLSFDASGLHLLAASGATATVFDHGAGTATTLAIPGVTIYGAAFSRDGRHVVTASSDLAARVWDWRAQKVIAQSRDHADFVLDASFSADGTLVATACADGTIAILDWRPAAGGTTMKAPVAVLTGHEGQVRKVGFFEYEHQGRKLLALVSAGFDGTVRTWERHADTGRWQQTAQLPGASGPVYAIASTPDGTQILAGGADKVARLYYRDANWLFNLAATRVTRELTEDERIRYDLPRK